MKVSFPSFMVFFFSSYVCRSGLYTAFLSLFDYCGMVSFFKCYEEFLASNA